MAQQRAQTIHLTNHSTPRHPNYAVRVEFTVDRRSASLAHFLCNTLSKWCFHILDDGNIRLSVRWLSDPANDELSVGDPWGTIRWYARLPKKNTNTMRMRATLVRSKIEKQIGTRDVPMRTWNALLACDPDAVGPDRITLLAEPADVSSRRLPPKKLSPPPLVDDKTGKAPVPKGSVPFKLRILK